LYGPPAEEAVGHERGHQQAFQVELKPSAHGPIVLGYWSFEKRHGVALYVRVDSLDELRETRGKTLTQVAWRRHNRGVLTPETRTSTTKGHILK